MKITAIEKQPELNFDNKAVQQDIPTDFPLWLHEQIIKETKNFTRELPLEEDQVDLISEWADINKPNLMGINLQSAYQTALQWEHTRLATQYKTNDVVFNFKDGWKIVKLPQSEYSSKTPESEHIKDLDIEKELMQVGEDYQNIYRTNNSYIEDGVMHSGDREGLFYSLRDPTNYPRATLDFYFYKETPKYLHIGGIFSNEGLTEDPRSMHVSMLHPRKDYIKAFFTYLKSQGYQIVSPESPTGDDVKAHQLEDYDLEDQFGLPYELWGVGGSPSNYYDSLLEAYEAGGDRYWSESKAKKVVNDVISYAEARNEIPLLEQAYTGFATKDTDKSGKPISKYTGIQEWAQDSWFQAEGSIDFQNPYPGEEPDPKDFTKDPDTSTPDLPGMPAAGPQFDKAAYDEAMKEYKAAEEAFQEETSAAEEEFEPMKFSNYVYNAIEEAKARQTVQPKTKTKTKKAETMDTKIIKVADMKVNDKLPDGETMALYVLTLKQYLKDNSNIPEEWQKLIEQLPAPRKVRQDFSFQELKLLYETLEYLWEKVTKQRIVPEKEITRAPETLFGNYWMINKGILLKGINHYGIVKQNCQLMCSLLDISGMAIQQYLADRPMKLIHFIIKYGGIRLFVTKDKRLYAQMSAETYGKWGRDKIRKLDFKLKAVNLIDPKAPYTGWKSGITVKL